MELAAIAQWHVVISGFLQNEGRPTGMVQLWRMLRRHSGPATCVELRNWNDNWRQFAELIHRVRPAASEPAVHVYAYSWGAGWGAMNLARQMQERGLSIRRMLLSDPVYRSPLMIFRWMALVRLGAVAVPENVGRVTWFRQRLNRPAGHELVAENSGRTEIDAPIWAEAIHQYMDDLPQFHQACRQAAEEL